MNPRGGPYLLLLPSFLVLTVANASAAERAWSGSAPSNGDWTDRDNWASAILPLPGDDLRVSFGTGHLSNTNDYAAGTIFGNVTFAGSGYSIRGNGIGLSGGLAVTHSSGNTTLNLPITLQANQTFSVTQPGATLFLNDDIHMGTRTLTFDVAGQITVSGNIDNNTSFQNQLRKQGAGLLRLLAPTDYNAATVINGGTLRLDGVATNSFFVVNSTGTLRGSGLLGGLGANSGGTVQPGFINPGFLHVFGNVELRTGSRFSVRLTSDQLRVHGTVTLSGMLSATAEYAPPIGRSFIIIDNDETDPVAGTFAGLPQGSIMAVDGLPFRISYFGHTGNDVVLTRVNAPAAELDSISVLGTGHMRIQGVGLNGVGYTIQAVSNLHSALHWIPIGNGTGNQAGFFQFVDTNAPQYRMRFYRAVSP